MVQRKRVKMMFPLSYRELIQWVHGCIKTCHTGGSIGSMLSSTRMVLHQPLSKFTYRMVGNLFNTYCIALAKCPPPPYKENLPDVTPLITCLLHSQYVGCFYFEIQSDCDLGKSIPTSFHTTVIVWERYRDGLCIFIFTFISSLPCLCYFLACHLCISFHIFFSFGQALLCA